MADKHSLSLVIRAVDKATGPLRAVNARITDLTDGMRKRFGPALRPLGNALRAFSQEADLPRIGKAFAKVGTELKGVGKAAMGVGKALLGFAAAGVGAGIAAFSIARAAIDAGDKLGEMAQRVGLSVNAYAQLSFAAAQADVDQEQFNASMDQFNKRLGEAKSGTGPLLAFLNKVSPSLAKSVKGAKTTEAAFDLMVNAMAKVQDPGKRAALAAAAFGKSGLQMGQFLGQGSAAIDAYRKRFVALAGDQEEFARRSGILDNTLRETEVAFTAVRNSILTAMAPALNKLSASVTDFVAKNREGIAKWAEKAGGEILKWVNGGGIERLVKGFGEITTAVGGAASALGGFKAIAVAVAVVLSSQLLVSIGQLAVALVELKIATAPMLIAFGLFVVAAAAVAAAGYQIYKNWDDLKLLFKDFWRELTPLFDAGWKKIQPIIDGLGSFFGNGTIGTTFKVASAMGQAKFGAERPTLGASNMRGPQSTEARVFVDFANAPKGTRVSADKSSTAQIDWSVGQSMVTP